MKVGGLREWVFQLRSSEVQQEKHGIERKCTAQHRMDPPLCWYCNGLERGCSMEEEEVVQAAQKEVCHTRSGRAFLSSHLPDWQRRAWLKKQHQSSANGATRRRRGQTMAQEEDLKEEHLQVMEVQLNSALETIDGFNNSNLGRAESKIDGSTE
eukprot:scaffold221401_cov48-Attheya_sp.AAC.1